MLQRSATEPAKLLRENGDDGNLRPKDGSEVGANAEAEATMARAAVARSIVSGSTKRKLSGKDVTSSFEGAPGKPGQIQCVRPVHLYRAVGESAVIQTDNRSIL
jgi:hypothetical protein